MAFSVIVTSSSNTYLLLKLCARLLTQTLALSVLIVTIIMLYPMWWLWLAGGRETANARSDGTFLNVPMGECESNAVSLSLYYNRNIQRRIGSISHPTANQIRANTLANHAHDLRDFNTLPTELVFTGIVYWEVQWHWPMLAAFLTW